MIKRLSARNSLFLYVKTHPQLQYYFGLRHSRTAANEDGKSMNSAKIINMREATQSMRLDARRCGRARKSGSVLGSFTP